MSANQNNIPIMNHFVLEMSLEEKLKHIIDTSYNFLLGQVGNGRIVIQNEASMQLHFAYILKSIGELMQFSYTDVFSIKLETPYVSGSTLNKSGSKKAKIDIALTLSNNETLASCAIELKHFQKDNHREPNNRYDAYNDLQNLEDYVSSTLYSFGVFLLATDHLHYVNQNIYSADTADYDLRQGSSYTAGRVLEYRTSKPYGVPIILMNDYNFTWVKAGPMYFLKHFIK